MATAGINLTLAGKLISKIRINFQTKVIIGFTVLAGIVSLVIIYGMYIISRDMIMDELRNRLITLATTTAALIDGDKHALLKTPADENTDIYRELQQLLLKIRDTNQQPGQEIKYIYTMVKTDNPDIYEFVVKSWVTADENRDSIIDPIIEEISHIGDKYDISNFPQMRKAFDQPIADKEIALDLWGSRSSGYAPIYNSKGEPVAIVGVALSADNVVATLDNLKKKAIISWCSSLLLALTVSFIISFRISHPIKQLKKATDQISKGNFSYKPKLRGNDEFVELFYSFKMTAEKLKNTVNELLLYQNDAKKRIANLMLLHEVEYTIGSALSLDDVLKRIVNVIKERFNYLYCSILLINETTNELKVKAYTGYSPELVEGFTIKVGEQGITGWVAAHGKPLTLPDVSKDTRYIKVVDEVKSEAAFPIILRDRVIGVLDIATDELNGFDKETLELFEILSRQISIAIENAKLYEELELSYFDTIKSLANAIEAKDLYTHGHCERVTELSLRIADAVHFSDNEKKWLKYAATLHDIGKIGITGKILNKPDRLTKEEYDIAKLHPQIGVNILQSVKFLEPAYKYILYHQERYDGSGYPEGLKAEQIPLGARIIAVADTYDALISERPYRSAYSLPKAIKELQRCAGSQLDPELLQILLQIIENNMKHRKPDTDLVYIAPDTTTKEKGE